MTFGMFDIIGSFYIFFREKDHLKQHSGSILDSRRVWQMMMGSTTNTEC